MLWVELSNEFLIKKKSGRGGGGDESGCWCGDCDGARRHRFSLKFVSISELFIYKEHSPYLMHTKLGSFQSPYPLLWPQEVSRGFILNTHFLFYVALWSGAMVSFLVQRGGVETLAAHEVWTFWYRGRVETLHAKNIISYLDGSLWTVSVPTQSKAVIPFLVQSSNSF